VTEGKEEKRQAVAASVLGSIKPTARASATSILDAPKISSDLGAGVRTLQDFFVVCQEFIKDLSNKVIDQREVFLEV
jgi:hypothetical protein